MEKIISLIKLLHSRLVFKRRAHVISSAITVLIPDGASVLDIGCGNGEVSLLVKKSRPDISIWGLETLKRPDCLIDCKLYDGVNIPLEDSSVDVCMFIDVLHHTAKAEELLREACRVSRKFIIIKDHLYENSFDLVILKFMDWVGNRPYKVKLVYNYALKEAWEDRFSSNGLIVDRWIEKMRLYPFILNYIFGRKLHFITLLRNTYHADKSSDTPFA